VVVVVSGADSGNAGIAPSRGTGAPAITVEHAVTSTVTDKAKGTTMARTRSFTTTPCVFPGHQIAP
jgi:hypothetical protein